MSESSQADRPVRFHGNQPLRPLRTPSRRHRIAQVTQRTRTRRRNTVIEPWVDVASDVAAINAGNAVRNGNMLSVHGRTYGVEPGGVLYPIGGPGFVELSRQSFKALGVYNRFGNTIRALEILDAMRVSAADRQVALEAWNAAIGEQS